MNTPVLLALTDLRVKRASSSARQVHSSSNRCCGSMRRASRADTPGKEANLTQPPV